MRLTPPKEEDEETKTKSAGSLTLTKGGFALFAALVVLPVVWIVVAKGGKATEARFKGLRLHASSHTFHTSVSTFSTFRDSSAINHSSQVPSSSSSNSSSSSWNSYPFFLDDPKERHEAMREFAQELNLDSRRVDEEGEGVELSSEEEEPRHAVFVLPRVQLVFCSILKNAHSTMENVLFELEYRGKKDPIKTKGTTLNNYLHRHLTIRNTTRYRELVHDDSWHKLVVLRDPLERLVSAFRNRCLGTNPSLKRKDPSSTCLGEPTTNFTVFAERLLHQMRHGHVINAHFRGQVRACLLPETMHNYQVIVYDQEVFMDQVRQFLVALKRKDVLDVLPNGQKHWTRSGSEELVRSMFTPELAKQMARAFVYDYTLLNMSYPSWLRQMLQTK